MEVGNLVKNLNSESRMCGVIVDFTDRYTRTDGYSPMMPVVLWSDGRCAPIMPNFVEKVNESR